MSGVSSQIAIDNDSKRFPITVASIGLLLGAVAFWGTNTAILGLFHDDGIYAVVAKALAQGDGYRIISLPTAPAQTKYPFLYSYLLSWLWVLNSSFPQNIVLLKGLNMVVFTAIFFVAVAFYRRAAPGSTTAPVVFAVLVCCNPIIFGFTDYVLSDLWLVFLSLCALTLCASGQAEQTNFWRLPLLAGVTGLACLSRSAALPLVFAGALYALTNRGWRAAAWFVIGVSVVIAPWLIWLGYHSEAPMDSLFAYYSAYDLTGIAAPSLAPNLERLWSIIQGNLRYLSDMLELFYLTPLLPGVGFGLAFFSVIGMIASARRADIFAWSFLVLSIAILLVWPFHPGRYLAPLTPLLLLFLFRGMARVHAWLDTAVRNLSWWHGLSRLAWSPVLVILLLDGFWLSGYLFYRDDQTTRGLYGRRLPYSWSGFEESFAYIRAHAKPDALLATAYDPMYYLYTGRQAIRPARHRPASYFYPYGKAQPDVGSVAEIAPQLAKLRINYLIVDPMEGYAEGKATVKLFDDLVRSLGRQAETVFTSSDGKHRIYRLVYN